MIWGMLERGPVAGGMHLDPGYHRLEGGIWGFPKSLILMALAKISPPLSACCVPCLLGRHLPPEPVHPRELSPRPPSQGKLNTMMEDFRSSASPKPTAVPFASLAGPQPPLRRKGPAWLPHPPGDSRPPSPTAGTLRDCAPAAGSRRPPRGDAQPADLRSRYLLGYL